MFSGVARSAIIMVLGISHESLGQLGSKDPFFEEATTMWDPAEMLSKAGSPCAAGASCDACAPDEFEGCEEIKAQCERTVCNPLCLRSSWSLKVKAAGCSGWDGCEAFTAQVESPGTQTALTSQFKGAGCGSKFSFGMKCCGQEEKENTDWMAQWVEDRTYAGMFPYGGIPVEACLHDPNDKDWKGCDACKGAIKVEGEPNDSHYADPPDYGGEGKQEPAPSEADKAFTNAGEAGPSQVPGFSGMQKRHEELKTKLAGSIPAMIPEFEKGACTCLGCCDEDPAVMDGQSCFYPIFTNKIDPKAFS